MIQLYLLISDPEDPRLKTITEYGDMCKKMISLHGRRVKLTRDTALVIYGLAELLRHLLSTTHQYVALSKFMIDKLKKSFSNSRQGCGGTNLIQCSKYLKLTIQHGKPYSKPSTVFLHSR